MTKIVYELWYESFIRINYKISVLFWKPCHSQFKQKKNSFICYL